MIKGSSTIMKDFKVKLMAYKNAFTSTGITGLSKQTPTMRAINIKGIL
jgi:hypothetical protein